MKRRRNRLYCDMDGVAADFDTAYVKLTGIKPCRVEDNIDWDKVRAHGSFFQSLPVMPDFHKLWGFIRRYQPTFLTGIPKQINAADNEKHTWLHHNVGRDVPIICCPSKDKALYCQPGDVIIDDWEKYRDRWEAAGGIWVTHTSADDTIRQLQELGL